MVFTALALLGRSTLLAVVAAATVELSRKGASGKGEGGEGDSAHSLTRPLGNADGDWGPAAHGRVEGCRLG